VGEEKGECRGGADPKLDMKDPYVTNTKIFVEWKSFSSRGVP